MTFPTLGRRVLVCVALIALLGLSIGASVADADPLPETSLEYSLEPQAYENVALAAYVGDVLYPRIVIDRSLGSPFLGTTYLIGLKGDECGRLVVVRSFDRGESWEPPRVADPCLPGLSLDVVIDDEGALHAVGWGPKVLRSTDGGLSWSLTADLGEASAPATIAFDPVTADLHVAWAPLDVVEGTSPTTLRGPVMVASSRNRGETWGEPQALAASMRGSHPRIAASASSVILTFVGTTGLSDPYVVTVASQDGGRTWSSPMAMAEPNACSLWSAPSAAAGPSGIFAIVWFESGAMEAGSSSCWEDGGLSTQTFVSLSRDGGRTFSGPYRAGGPPGWPTVAYFGGAVVFDDESRLYITWSSLSRDGASVHVSHSTNLQGPFDQAVFTTHLWLRAGEATGQGNLALGPDGVVYLVWRAESAPFEAPSSGIFVRSVSGQVAGGVRTGGWIDPRTPVQIELYDTASDRLKASAAWMGSTVVLGEFPPSTYDVWIRFGQDSARAGSIPIATWRRTSFTIHVERPAAGPAGPSPIFLEIGVAGAILFLASLVAAHQYTRVQREDVLQRKIRLLMYEYVCDHPGSSFSEVRDVLGLKNGVASYHLGVLERQGLLSSASKRHRRWYFANGDATQWKGLPLSPLQRTLIRVVQQRPGIGIRELARAVDRRPSSVSDNVKSLAREGFLRTQRAGRRMNCFPSGESPQA